MNSFLWLFLSIPLLCFTLRHYSEEHDNKTFTIIQREHSFSSNHFNRLLSDEDTNDKGDDEVFWREDDDKENEGDAKDEDEQDEDNDERTQINRPGNDDNNHYDCASMVHYLDHLPPECQHWGKKPDVTDGAPTAEPSINDNEAHLQMDDILVHMNFRVGIRKKLRPRQVFRLRAAVANSVSFILHRKSPFHVPIPFWNDGILDYLFHMEYNETDEDDENPNIPFLNDQSNPQDDTLNFDSNGWWRPVDREPPMDPTLILPSSIDPTSFSDEIPDIPDIEKRNYRAGSLQKKGNIWLHHYSTDLCDDVIQNATTQRWYYPVEVRYMVFWDVLSHLIEDPQVLANVTRVCWHIGNDTIANGVLKQVIIGEIENDTVFDAIDPIFGDDDTEEWGGLDGDLIDLNGDGDVSVPAEPGLSDGILPEFPTNLKSSSWGRREYFGLYLMICTLTVVIGMHLGATRTEKSQSQPEWAPNGETNLLTKDGVDDLLKVGWKYHKQKAEDDDSSQLYLHVYDKSVVGYSLDNSMLMGGNEETDMDADKPDELFPSQTESSLEHEASSTAHRESLTLGSTPMASNTMNSKESSLKTAPFT